MPKNMQSGRNTNNSQGRNQYSNGWMGTARERPVATAAAAAAAVGAGVFLWSRRNQISDQISNLSDQIGEWSGNMMSNSNSRELETVGGGSNFSASGSGSDQASGGSTGRQFDSPAPSSSNTPMKGAGSDKAFAAQSGGHFGGTSGMSETGGGNASLGKQTGGGGMGASQPSGRGRA